MPATPRTAPAANLQALRLHYPDAPAAEVLRFATAEKRPRTRSSFTGTTSNGVQMKARRHARKKEQHRSSSKLPSSRRSVGGRDAATRSY